MAQQVPERKRPSSLEAYDLCVRGRALFSQSPQAALEARLLFERAIALDPGFSEAHRWLAISIHMGSVAGGQPRESAIQLALATALKAVELDLTTQVLIGRSVYCWRQSGVGQKRKQSSLPH